MCINRMLLLPQLNPSAELRLFLAKQHTPDLQIPYYSIAPDRNPVPTFQDSARTVPASNTPKPIWLHPSLYPGFRLARQAFAHRSARDREIADKIYFTILTLCTIRNRYIDAISAIFPYKMPDVYSIFELFSRH